MIWFNRTIKNGLNVLLLHISEHDCNHQRYGVLSVRELRFRRKLSVGRN